MYLKIEERGVEKPSVMEIKALVILDVTLDGVEDHQEHVRQKSLRLGVNGNSSQSSLNSKHSKGKSRNCLMVSDAIDILQHQFRKNQFTPLPDVSTFILFLNGPTVILT